MWHSIVNHGLEILLLLAAIGFFAEVEIDDKRDDEWHVHPMNKESMNYKE